MQQVVRASGSIVVATAVVRGDCLDGCSFVARRGQERDLGLLAVLLAHRREVMHPYDTEGQSTQQQPAHREHLRADHVTTVTGRGPRCLPLRDRLFGGLRVAPVVGHLRFAPGVQGLDQRGIRGAEVRRGTVVEVRVGDRDGGGAG